jgi:hypothetical protein
MKLRVTHTNRSFEQNVETIQLTVTDDAGKQLEPRQMVVINAPADLLDLRTLSKDQLYTLDLKPVAK